MMYSRPPLVMFPQPPRQYWPAVDNQSIVRETIRILCNADTSMLLPEVCRQLGRMTPPNQTGFRPGMREVYSILKSHPKNFEILQADGTNDCFVSVSATLGLCSKHCSKDGNCPGLPLCDSLHVCKFYLLSDSCRFKGNQCHFGHNLKNTHNLNLLRENLLDHLSVQEIKNLFRKSECRSTLTLMPRVCKFYNNESGCRYKTEHKECPQMHICRYYLIGECRFGRHCKRSHNLYETQVQTILNRHGIDTNRSPKEVLSELRKVGVGASIDTASTLGSTSGSRYSQLAKARQSSTVTANTFREVSQVSFSVSSDSNSSDYDEDDDHSEGSHNIKGAGQSSQRQKSAEGVVPELCIYYLRDKCAFGRSCRRYHRNLPYQWQYSSDTGIHWDDLPDEDHQNIELNYSMVKEDGCFFEVGMDVYWINFDQMKATAKNKPTLLMRRLTTVARETAIAHPLSTEWNWYWLDQASKWILYGRQNMTGYRSAKGSDDIEENYLENPEGQMKLSTLGHEYLLDFKHMIQINIQTGVQRKVRRRSVFVTKQDVGKNKKKSIAMSGAVGSKMVASRDLPATWSVDVNISCVEFCDYFKKIPVSNSETLMKSDTKIIDLFQESMPGARITSVERIENGELWMNFCSKREKMKRKSSTGDVNERQLFHGTHHEYVDAICRQGFDFRFSGKTTGTKFGKGSYFAKNARFADSYTDSDKAMFVVKVLAGEMTKGSPEYVRPPPKDNNSPLDLYDCCVDNVKNPNIFVIFTFDQVYPEYLITYRVRR